MSVAEPRPLRAGPSIDSVTDPEVESIARSLQAKLSAPSDVLARVVAEELLRFQGARVRNFIPILVERAAAHRLARSAEGAGRDHR